ncbi:MAG: 7-cyano-7-deazaguanine synthase [Terriglobales bacterium]
MSELLLLSGGVDSIAMAAWRRPAVCLTVDYGQIPAEAEIDAANVVCATLDLRHDVVRLPLRNLGSGLLAGETMSPLSDNDEFWPFRNQLLITIGAMRAARESISAVVIGTVRNDSRHSDGRPAFLSSMARLLEMQEGALTLMAPAAQMDTSELIRASGVPLGVLGWAHSCHRSKLACGDCPGCYKHSDMMQRLGLNR